MMVLMLDHVIYIYIFIYYIVVQCTGLKCQITTSGAQLLVKIVPSKTQPAVNQFGVTVITYIR
jgi:hypothetical protein